VRANVAEVVNRFAVLLEHFKSEAVKLIYPPFENTFFTPDFLDHERRVKGRVRLPFEQAKGFTGFTLNIGGQTVKRFLKPFALLELHNEATKLFAVSNSS